MIVISYFIHNVKPEQVKDEKSIEETLKDLKRSVTAYKKNLDQRILFYQNDANAGEILEVLYLEKGEFSRKDEKYSKAYECFKKALSLAQKNGNKNNEALAIWNLIWLASLQNKTDVVLDLNSKFENIIEPKFDWAFMPAHFYYYWIGKAYLQRNDLENAERYLNYGLKIVEGKYSWKLKHPTLLACAISILASKKHDLPKALKYLNIVANSFSDFNSKYYKEQKKCFYNALSIFEKSTHPCSVRLSLLYKKIAELYRNSDNKLKFEEYIFKAIKVLEELKERKEKIAALYYELGRFNNYPSNKYFDKCIEILKGIKGKEAANITFKVACDSYDENSKKSLRLLLLSLKMLPKLNKKPLWVARACHLIAYCYNERKEWQKSAEYAQKCLKLVKSNDKIEHRFPLALGCYSFLDDLYKSQRNLIKRIKNAEDAVTFMRNNKCDLILLNAAYGELGKIYKFAKRYSDAEKSYRKIIEIMNKNPKLRENTEYLKQEIDAYCEIGDLCLYQKAKVRALTAFNQASKLIQKKTVSELSKWYIAKTFRSIADGYYYLDKDAPAEKYYKKAVMLLLTQKDKDYKTISYLYYRIGNIAYHQQNWQKAKEHFEKSWKNINKQEYDVDSIILLANKLSVSYLKVDELKKALKFSLLAYKEQKKKYGNNLQTGVYAFTVGSAYDKLKDKNNAVKYLSVAYEIFLKYKKKNPYPAQKAERYLQKLQKR